MKNGTCGNSESSEVMPQKLRHTAEGEGMLHLHRKQDVVTFWKQAQQVSGDFRKGTGSGGSGKKCGADRTLPSTHIPPDHTAKRLYPG